MRPMPRSKIKTMMMSLISTIILITKKKHLAIQIRLTMHRNNSLLVTLRVKLKCLTAHICQILCTLVTLMTILKGRSRQERCLTSLKSNKSRAKKFTQRKKIPVLWKKSQNQPNPAKRAKKVKTRRQRLANQLRNKDRKKILFTLSAHTLVIIPSNNGNSISRIPTLDSQLACTSNLMVKHPTTSNHHRPITPKCSTTHNLVITQTILLQIHRQCLSCRCPKAIN